MNFWPKWPHGETLRPHDSEVSTRSPLPGWSAEWPPAAAGLVLALLGYGYAFWDTIAHTVATWRDSATFNHGFLILPICAFLAWERRRSLAEIEPRPYLPALAIGLFCVFGWMLGNLATARVAEQLALVALVQTTVLGVLGTRATRVLAFPLFYLIFAVPFGESLVPPLQDLTAAFVVSLLRLIDVPVFVDGIFISIPTGNFVVAEACSGIRYLIAMVALGFLYADLNYHSFRRKALFVALSFAVPIVANGVRAFGIVYLAYLTDHTIAVGADHILYGWVFFAIVTLILIGIGAKFRDVPPPPSPTYRTAAAAERKRVAASALVVALSLAALAYGGRAYTDYANDGGLEAAGEALRLPDAPAGWSRFDRHADAWRPEFKGADETRMATYVRDGKAVYLFTALYRHQTSDAKLVTAANSVVGEGVWARAGSGGATAVVDGNPVTVLTTRMVRNDAGRLVWHWFWIDGRNTSNSYVAKLLETKVKLFDLPRAAAIVAVAADYVDGPGEAAALLDEFLRAVPDLSSGLRRATGH